MGVYNTSTNTWEHDTAYTYDSMSRLATLASLGKSATYTRISLSNRLSNVAFSNNVGAPNIGYTYDYQLRLAGKGGISRGFNSKDEVQYTSGDNHYGYDGKGQLARWGIGVIKEGVLIGTSIEYDYDEIGNVLSDGLTYNNVNQPSNLTYDADGNMTKNGSTLYTYDAENRLKTMGTSGNYKEFFYDYAGRCFKRQTVRKTTTTSVTVNEYLIYDKTKIIAVLNGSASAITEKYTWQPPTSGDADVLLWDATSVYLTDCNKNIVKRYYFNIDAWQNLVDTYSYTPFGTLTSGSATPFRFGFSSEESYNGLYLYLYRAYNPTLKRWLTRDPIEENGGVNLYNFVGNNSLSRWDNWGWQGIGLGGLGGGINLTVDMYMPSYNQQATDAIKRFVITGDPNASNEIYAESLREFDQSFWDRFNATVDVFSFGIWEKMREIDGSNYNFNYNDRIEMQCIARCYMETWFADFNNSLFNFFNLGTLHDGYSLFKNMWEQDAQGVFTGLVSFQLNYNVNNATKQKNIEESKLLKLEQTRKNKSNSKLNGKINNQRERLSAATHRLNVLNGIVAGLAIASHISDYYSCYCDCKNNPYSH